ncbi:phage tail protein [Streptococcus pneumoniae]|nr:phage tail protein [Streptococcus pneumoniae]
MFFDGSHYDFIIPEIKDKKSAKIHITLGALRDWPLVSHMYVDEFQLELYFSRFVKKKPTVTIEFEERWL